MPARGRSRGDDRFERDVRVAGGSNFISGGRLKEVVGSVVLPAVVVSLLLLGSGLTPGLTSQDRSVTAGVDSPSNLVHPHFLLRKGMPRSAHIGSCL